uniref:EGF-like domain-containing protein n=2 Tax=Macrostomum lignano TaxID=282301 RepID=A0A1I8HYG4_9PLAT
SRFHSLFSPDPFCSQITMLAVLNTHFYWIQLYTALVCFFHQLMVAAAAVASDCWDRYNYIRQCSSRPCEPNHYFGISCLCKPCPSNLSGRDCLVQLGICPQNQIPNNRLESDGNRASRSGDTISANEQAATELSAGKVAAICCAVVVVLAIIAAVGFLFVYKRRNRARNGDHGKHGRPIEDLEENHPLNDLQDHNNQPPDHNNQPPDHNNQPPDHNNQPPDHNNQPPDHNNQLPDHNNQPPDHNNQPPMDPIARNPQ